MKYHSSPWFNTVPSFFLVLYIFCAISPALAWTLCIGILLGLTDRLQKEERIILAIFATLGGALMISSREVFQVETDDFTRYFDLYQSLHDGNYQDILSYGGGFEVLLPLVLSIIGMAGPRNSPQFVLFFLSFLCFITFYLWLEYRGLRAASIDEDNKAACIGSALLLFSLFDTTQIVRQMYSVVFMLFALTSSTKKSISFFLLIASGFHLSAIPVYFSILIFRYIGYIGITILAIFFFYFDLTAIEDLLLQGDTQGSARLGWLLNSENLSVWLYGIFIMSVLGMIFLFKNPKGNDSINWKFPVIGYCLIYFSLLSIPGASFRLCLMFISVIPGYLIFSALSKYAPIVRTVFILFLIQRTYKNISLPSSDGLWTQFDRWGTPFHFIF